MTDVALVEGTGGREVRRKTGSIVLVEPVTTRFTMSVKSGKNRTSRWMVAGAVAAVSAAVLGLYLGLGTTQADADVLSTPSTMAVAAGVQPAFEGAQVHEYVPGELTLAVDLKWTCAADRLGITCASGWLIFSNVENDDEVLRVHCDLGSPVTPSGETRQRLDLDWDEWDDAHAWLRAASEGQVHVRFDVESASGITRAEGPDAPVASATPGRGPVRISR